MMCRVRHYALPGALALVSFMLTAGSSAIAQVVNPGFESSPDFAGWSTVGASSITNSSFGVNPTEGLNQALLTTDATSGAVDVAALESALGLSGGALTGLGKGTVVNGSGFVNTTAFTATAGQQLTFDWDFLTNELDPSLNNSYNDFAFYTFNGVATALADVQTGAFITPLHNSNSTDYLDETGYAHGVPVTITIPTTGTYFIGFGVVNVGVNDTASGLLVDNIVLSNGGSSPSSGTPEPGAFALLSGLGVCGIAAHRRRKRTV